MYNYIHKIKWNKFLCFYTIWAFILHLLYFKGYIGNTFPIALFVFICSQVIAVINPKYPYVLPFEFFFHFLPLFIIPISFEHNEYLVLSFILYLLLVNTDSFRLYLNPIKFLI
jgi:hypothetical protein